MGRDEVVAGSRGRRLVRGRRVLVTGACGTVGSALCHQVKRLDPASLWLVDVDGEGLRRLGHEMTGRLEGARVHPAEADVRDRGRIAELVARARPDLVFHTAGQNDLCKVERDPCLGVAANVAGTRNVVDSAVRHDVERLVLVSSDKATEPTSVYGATMRLGEMLLLGSVGSGTRFAAVRVGNVLGPPGTLLSLLAHRISAGETVTITHPEVARHFLTAAEAAGVLLEASAMAEQAETFALDTGGPVPVVELVHRYAEQLRLPEVTIRFSGLGPGEKLAEKTFSDSEPLIRTAHPRIWATRPAAPPAGLPRMLDALEGAAEGGDAELVRLLLRRLLPEYRPARRPSPPVTAQQLCDAGCAPDSPAL